MARERSSIEVVFRALGHPQVQGAMRAMKTDAQSLSGTLKSVGGFTADKLAGGLRGVGSLMLGVVRNAGGLAPALRFGISAVGKLSDGLGQVRNLLIQGAIAAVGMGRGLKSFTDANAELQGTVLALRAINDETSKTNPVFRSAASGFGSANPGGYFLASPAAKLGGGLKDITGGGVTAQNLSFLNKVADEHGSVISEVAANYLKLTAAAKGSGASLGDIQRVFDGLSDANQVLGGSQDNFQRASVALQQIASKGQVMSEELKGQLAEAIPGAIGIAARAYDMSVTDFLKAVEEKQIQSAEFIRRFGAQLQEEYGAASDTLANTTRIASGRLKNAFFNARAIIANGALDRAAGRGFNAITAVLNKLVNNGAFTRFGEKLATSLERIIDRFERAAANGYDFEGVLDSIARGFDFVIRFGEGASDMFVRLKASVVLVVAEFDKLGLRIPPVNELMRNLGDEIFYFTRSVMTGNLEGSLLTRFLASTTNLAKEFGLTLISLVSGGSITTFTGAIEYLTYWMDQLGKAFQSFRTGKVAYGLDDTGAGMLTNIILAVSKFNELKTAAKSFFDVMSGGDGAGGFAKLNGIAAGLAALFTGKSQESAKQRTGKDGSINYDGELALFFSLRDILADTINFLINNKEAIASAFKGMLDVAAGIAAVVAGITGALSGIGINANIAYLAGAVFALSRITTLMFGLTKVIGLSGGAAGGAGLAGAFSGFGETLKGLGGKLKGARLASLGLIGGLAALTAYVASRYGNQIGGGLDRVRGFFGNKDAQANYEKTARLDQLADMLKQTGNARYRELTQQGYDPIDAARVIDEEVNARQALTNSTADLIRQQRELAAGMQAQNDNIDFGTGANDNGGSGAADQGFTEQVIINLSTGEQVEMRGRREDMGTFKDLETRTRAGRAPAFMGAG